MIETYRGWTIQTYARKGIVGIVHCWRICAANGDFLSDSCPWSTSGWARWDARKYIDKITE